MGSSHLFILLLYIPTGIAAAYRSLLVNSAGSIQIYTRHVVLRLYRSYIGFYRGLRPVRNTEGEHVLTNT